MRKTFLKNDPNLKECVKVLNKLKINHWICYGTLLGVIRNKYLLPWDNDIDIGTWEQKNKNKIISAFINRGFVLQNKVFGNKNLLSFEKGKNRKIDINFHEIDKTGKYAFIRHYAIKNIFCRVIYVMSVSKSYNGRFKSIVRLFSFLEKIFKKIKIILEKNNLFYIDAGFKTKIEYFKKLKSINFYDIKVNIPIFYKEFLNDQYGKNWRIPNKKYYWEKNKHKSIFS